jgi:hypothetical protein
MHAMLYPVGVFLKVKLRWFLAEPIEIVSVRLFSKMCANLKQSGTRGAFRYVHGAN